MDSSLIQVTYEGHPENSREGGRVAATLDADGTACDQVIVAASPAPPERCRGYAGAVPSLTAPHVITGSTLAAVGSAVATVSAAASTANAVTRAVGLAAQQVDVQDVEADAALAVATIATFAAVAALAAAGDEQGQDGTGREQLHVLSVDRGKAQCIRHEYPH